MCGHTFAIVSLSMPRSARIFSISPTCRVCFREKESIGPILCQCGSTCLVGLFLLLSLPWARRYLCPKLDSPLDHPIQATSGLPQPLVWVFCHLMGNLEAMQSGVFLIRSFWSEHRSFQSIRLGLPTGPPICILSTRLPTQGNQIRNSASFVMKPYSSGGVGRMSTVVLFVDGAVKASRSWSGLVFFGLQAGWLSSYPNLYFLLLQLFPPPNRIKSHSPGYHVLFFTITMLFISILSVLML